MAFDPMTTMLMLGMGGGYSPEMGAQNPFGTGGGASNNVARQIAPLRAMGYINRESRMGMQTPRTTRSGAGNRFLPGGPGSDGMDYSQFTFDPAAHDAATKFLGQYGLSPLDPSQVKPNTVLPNSGFFANHPRLSGMLEGGIYGAAASQGANTWGEGIQSVANSLIAGPRMRAAAYQQQFEKPFQAAHMLEGMQDMAQKRELTSAQIERERAYTQALKDKPDPFHAATAIPATASSFITYENGVPTQHENKYFDKTSGGSKNTPGVAPVLRYIRQLYGNVDPDSLGKDQWAAVNKLAANEAVKVAGARTAADAIARINAEYRMGKNVPLSVKEGAKEAGKDWLDPKNKEVRATIRRNGLLKDNKLMTEDEVNAVINQHNLEVNEKIKQVYDGWQDKFNQQNPSSPMPY